MKSTLRKIAISLVLTIAILGLAEGLVRVLGIQPKPWPSADGRQVPQIRIDPLLGPLPTPEYVGKWFGFDVEIDADGFRSTGTKPPSEDAPRVAFVGDSCTFGWGLDTAETYIAQLDSFQRNERDRPFALRNGGYPGQTAVVGEHMVRELVLPWSPDAIVIAFSGNNAFRLTRAPHVSRFRFFGLRKLMLKSRLFHIVASELANSREPGGHPRNRDQLLATPIEQIFRVARPEDFEASVRNMIRDSRADGAKPVILLFARASQVSTDFAFEDAASSHAKLPLRRNVAGGADRPREIGLLEMSCIDVKSANPIGVLYEEIGEWEAIYPSDPGLRRMLQDGARSYVEGNFEDAQRVFDAAVVRAPRSPLAWYDVGATRLAGGDVEAGLEALDKAEELACNIFLEYQVRLRRIAAESDVPVVDLMMLFQAHQGESLYIDPAHPSTAGAALIAEALSSEFDSLF